MHYVIFLCLRNSSIFSVITNIIMIMQMAITIICL